MTFLQRLDAARREAAREPVVHLSVHRGSCAAEDKAARSDDGGDDDDDDDDWPALLLDYLEHLEEEGWAECRELEARALPAFAVRRRDEEEEKEGTEHDEKAAGASSASAPERRGCGDADDFSHVHHALFGEWVRLLEVRVRACVRRSGGVCACACVGLAARSRERLCCPPTRHHIPTRGDRRWHPSSRTPPNRRRGKSSDSRDHVAPRWARSSLRCARASRATAASMVATATARRCCEPWTRRARVSWTIGTYHTARLVLLPPFTHFASASDDCALSRRRCCE